MPATNRRLFSLQLARGVVVALFLTVCCRTHAAEDQLTKVTLTGQGDESQRVEGKVLIEAVDKSFLLLARDGQLWSIADDQVDERTTADEPFSPYSAKELSERLRAEFGDGFFVHTTKHYVICANTDKKYAQWCGLLFQRLMSAFQNHWRNSKIEMHDPDMPLVAIVFSDRKHFADYALRDQGPTVVNAQGYYSTRTNRIALYDLTTELGGRRGPVGDVGEQLEASLSNVATIVHEATHQIAFNCGMHTRYAENPLWLVEGMAMYFETPDVRSAAGWKTLGKINTPRLRTFQEYLRQRRDGDSLASLISGDKRLSEQETAPEAYAESWAFSYFLIKTKRKQYTEYLKLLSKKSPLKFGSPEDRLKEFRSIFGDDLEKLDRDFVKYISRL
jgi:hypothetical protein